MRALKIAATGMAAQQMRVETISNNLANMSTTGYNTRRAEFSDQTRQALMRRCHSWCPVSFCRKSQKHSKSDF